MASGYLVSGYTFDPIEKIYKLGKMRISRGQLSWVTKCDIVNSQLGKCAHCDYTAQPIIGRRSINKTTGEIRDVFDLMFFEFHHIIPLSKGGDDHIKNIEAVCIYCHKKLTKKGRNET